jgi:hypothetical protein
MTQMLKRVSWMSFSFVKQGDYAIASIETSKDAIEQPELAAHENMYIPPLGSSVIISGKSGSVIQKIFKLNY